MDNIMTKVLKQGPFLILMEGVNSGKKCVVGVFCVASVMEPEMNLSIEHYSIPLVANTFLFYYQENHTLHFDLQVQNATD